MQISAEQLEKMLTKEQPLPEEQVAAAKDPQAARESLSAQMVLAEATQYADEIDEIPQTTYTLYRDLQRTGDRRAYEQPYFLKRTKLGAAALRAFFFPEEASIDPVHDYLWDICEETNWVIPAHEQGEIDLFAAETAFSLAEVLVLLGGRLAEEVPNRVRAEVEKRIFQPFLERTEKFGWYRRAGNWNGVCSSSVGMAFLLLEKDRQQLAQALAHILESLEVFVDEAFEQDGASTEGVGYWQYGLLNFIPFAELLRARTQDQVDLLATDRMKTIAAYPPAMILSPGHFANFADCAEEIAVPPGFIARLAERTGADSLWNLIAQGAPLRSDLQRVGIALRNIWWWDGKQPKPQPPTDAEFPAAGVVKRVATTPEGRPVVLAAKAGHNSEKHNNNDVGSCLLHVDGETYLCDPGPGLYTRDYFSPHRYENIFANSFGHSVPRIDGQLQGAGGEFRGEILDAATEQDEKRVVIEFARAYPVPPLTSARRTLTLRTSGEEAGTMLLEDEFAFSGGEHEIEEAFVTWLEVQVDGAQAEIKGNQGNMELRILEPTGATFALQELTEESKANAKERVLKRLTVTLAVGPNQARTRMRMAAVPK